MSLILQKRWLGDLRLFQHKNKYLLRQAVLPVSWTLSVFVGHRLQFPVPLRFLKNPDRQEIQVSPISSSPAGHSITVVGFTESDVVCVVCSPPVIITPTVFTSILFNNT